MIKAYREINSISNELPALEGEKLTKPELSGKRFAFLYIEDNRGEEQSGVLRLDSDGTIGEYENPNEAEWEVDEAGRLLVRSKEGIVSTVFNKVSIIDGKYELSGPFMLYGEITHILREL
jgi:hypothetical protein